jgi:hypothetical protein
MEVTVRVLAIRAVLCGLAVWASGGAFAGQGGQVGGKAPEIFTSDGRDLVTAREKFKAGDALVKGVVGKMIADADKALSAGPFTVVNKKKLPPSGDKHDYASLSPYWWPDASKPDGVPYIRRDGEFNPERAEYDLTPLESLGSAVDALSHAYFFTGDEKYAAKCAELLRAWFIDPATRMNPNLKYAQFVPGYDKPRPSGIIEGGRFRDVVDALQMIEGSPSWKAEDDAALRKWFGELKTYILTSEQGMAELNTDNNHASWAHVQVATYALYSGDREKAKSLLESGFKRLIESQIKADGTQPEELARTMPFHYSRFNLLALIELASLGERVGLDLWKTTTADGRGIRTALDFLVPYATKEKAWERKDIRGVRPGDMVVVLRRAANAYGEAGYEAAARKIMATERREIVDVLFPSKLK